MFDAKAESEKRNRETLRLALGNDILRFLNDDNVVEIMVNPDQHIWIDTFDKGLVDSGKLMDPNAAQQVITQVASMTRQVCDIKHPLLAAELPDGSRFQGMLPRVVKSPSFDIRKHSKMIYHLEDYVRQGIMSVNQMDVIKEAVKNRKNIIAAGGTGTGKTTLLNAILAEISKYNDRVVMIEDLPELKCDAKDSVQMATTNNVDQNELVRTSLRLRPDRIVVGEVRGGEALELLKAWSTGHSGGCSTVHSNDAEKTLSRLEQLVSEKSLTPQQHTIAAAVDLIVYLRRFGPKRVLEKIISIEGFDDNTHQYIIKEIA